MKDERLEGQLLMKDCVFIKNPNLEKTQKDDDDDFDDDDDEIQDNKKLNILKES